MTRSVCTCTRSALEVRGDVTVGGAAPVHPSSSRARSRRRACGRSCPASSLPAYDRPGPSTEAPAAGLPWTGRVAVPFKITYRRRTRGASIFSVGRRRERSERTRTVLMIMASSLLLLTAQFMASSAPSLSARTVIVRHCRSLSAPSLSARSTRHGADDAREAATDTVECH
jgi:hypothetical protein